MDEKILLKSLVSNSFLSQESASKLERDAISLKKGIEDLIFERRLVPQENFLKVKSQILNIPYKIFNPEEISDDLLPLIPETTARQYKVVPLSRDKNLLVAGMVSPEDPASGEALRFIAKQNRVSLGVYLIGRENFDAAIRRYNPFSSEIQQAVKSLNVAEEQFIGRRVKLEEGGKSVEEAPVIKIVSSLLKEAVNAKASDIHVEPEKSRLRVRFRIDGKLKEQTSLPAALHQPVVSRIKVLSDLKIDENRIPQDGRFRTEIFGRDIDFRVATFPTPLGEKAAIRVLDPEVGLRSLSDLGLTGVSAEKVQRGIQKPFGMVLITGPTGSGKTTTLYALLQILNKEDVNIVSLEDPVEYFIEGVNQSQVRPEIGYDFASGLRQILRQDPDVIMVGEIRDTETAALSVHAALTGHLVFSTLHTNNALGVIPRLLDMKVDAFLLPPSLNLMMAQRLVSKICQYCKEANKVSVEVSAMIKKELDRLPEEIKSVLEYKEPYEAYHSPGCDKCNGRGVMGRVALFEVLEMTKELSQIINSSPTEDKIQSEARRQDMVTMRQDGILKALQGLVAIEEVLKETVEE